MLAGAQAGEFQVLLVTYQDRISRFGAGYIAQLLSAYGVGLEVLHPGDDLSPEQEMVADFCSLVACFSGRLYGQRSAQARARLLRVASSRDQED
jgi:putative resolvase